MIVAKCNLVTAHKLGSKAREILSYARRCGYIDTNPADDYTADLPPIKSQHRSHITDERKLAILLRAIDDYQEGSLQVRYALRIMPLPGVACRGTTRGKMGRNRLRQSDVDYPAGTA